MNCSDIQKRIDNAGYRFITNVIGRELVNRWDVVIESSEWWQQWFIVMVKADQGVKLGTIYVIGDRLMNTGVNHG